MQHTPNNNKPTEARIQQDCFTLYHNSYCLPQHAPNRCIIWHVANEGQQHLISIGLLPGVSDLIIIHKMPHMAQGLHVYIEVKTPTGKQSPAQIDFMHRIRALGYEYHVVRSRDEFIATVHAIELRLLQNFATDTKAPIY